VPLVRDATADRLIGGPAPLAPTPSACARSLQPTERGHACAELLERAVNSEPWAWFGLGVLLGQPKCSREGRTPPGSR